jgi:hypothetical protein
MPYLSISQDKKVLIDEDDIEYISRWKWSYHHGYAVRSSTINGIKKHILMHRVINNTPDGLQTDHINRDKLDNRKSNLRSVDSSQNNINRGISKRNKSGCNGVEWQKSRNKWRVRIGYNSKSIYLGSFTSIENAKLAYNNAINLYHGGLPE